MTTTHIVAAHDQIQVPVLICRNAALGVTAQGLGKWLYLEDRWRGKSMIACTIRAGTISNTIPYSPIMPVPITKATNIEA